MDKYEPYLNVANAVIAQGCKDYFAVLRELHDYEDSDGKKIAELRKINDDVERAWADDMCGKSDTDMQWYMKMFRKAGKIQARYHDLTIQKLELEKFFVSDWFCMLSRNSVDGERLMKYMRELEQSGAKSFNGKYEY